LLALNAAHEATLMKTPEAKQQTVAAPSPRSGLLSLPGFPDESHQGRRQNAKQMSPALACEYSHSGICMDIAPISTN
jgi:hypothetical protein